MTAGMDPDDHVCLCFHVSLRKLRNYIARENPPVPSRIADCLGAGTGCRWCVPFLVRLHDQHRAGEPMDLPCLPHRVRGATRPLPEDRRTRDARW